VLALPLEGYRLASAFLPLQRGTPHTITQPIDLQLSFPDHRRNGASANHIPVTPILRVPQFTPLSSTPDIVRAAPPVIGYQRPAALPKPKASLTGRTL
jgi:hypothetical protein